MISSEVLADLKAKLKVAAKRAEDVAYEKDCLQARSQHSQRGQVKVGESITRVQRAISHFCAGRKEDREYCYRGTDDEGRKVLSDVGAWMAKQVVEAQHTHSEASKFTINQYTSS